MTVLTRSSRNPGLVTIQCEICCPPAQATTREELLHDMGWRLRSRGATHDICAWCWHDAPYGRTPRLERAAAAPEGIGVLPNYFIIGAAKAGTTSLHNYLTRHPEIFAAELKELRYFTDPECESWRSLYEAQFPKEEVGAAIAIGESSTMYTRSPVLPGVAARMAALVPDARLIYLVRDPVDRALASYREEKAQMLDPREVAEAFADLDDPYNPYLAASRYAEQIEPYLEHFSREQILVLSMSDLAARSAETLAQIFTFLGVDPDVEIDTSVRYNEGSEKGQYSPLGHWLRFSGVGVLARRMPPSVHRVLVAPARRWLRKDLEAPTLPAELLEQIRQALAPDAARFRELTGLSFTDWSV